MSKIFAFILALFIAVGCALPLASCVTVEPPYTNIPESTPPSDDSDPSEDNGDSDKLVVPEYKDYGRGTCNFSEIVYTRPNADSVIEEIKSVTDSVKKNEIPLEEQIALIESLEDSFNNFLTMYSYANVMNSKDASEKRWADEFSYISKSYPSFSKAVEELYVAAACSEHAEAFEEQYFGEGLIEKYSDGGKYTDALVLLMEKESELESSYTSISTDTVKITYEAFTDKTFDYIIDFYETNYGKDSVSYKTAYDACLALYEQEVKSISIELLVELFRIRRKISDELGYDSYAKLAYGEIYHDYTEKDILSFIAGVKNYIIPVYLKTENLVFSGYFNSYSSSGGITDEKLLNDTYSAISSLDIEIADVFAYMLQHELYDVEEANENRFDGSFVTYFDDYEAPYLFLTKTGYTDDYLTLAHEFGHFIDNYANYGASTSLDLSEVSSNAFEWVMLDALKGILTQDEIKYLTYRNYKSAMEVYIYQGFYTLFEHYAYQLPEENINEHNLTLALKKAASDIGFSADAINSLEVVIIPHIMLYPFYVQSYCVSEAVALDMYLSAKENREPVIEAYKALVYRESDLEFSEHLQNANISLPFTSDYIRRIADRIHYQIIGSHCYPDNNGNEGIAF